MNIESYEDFVMALAKPGEVIANEITAEDAHLLHMAIGISGEAGELLDAIKKAVIYRKPLDLENVLEELGDLKFYIKGLQVACEFTDEQVQTHNVEKLSERYHSLTYSDQHAQERVDKS